MISTGAQQILDCASHSELRELERRIAQAMEATLHRQDGDGEWETGYRYGTQVVLRSASSDIQRALERSGEAAGRAAAQASLEGWLAAIEQRWESYPASA